MEIEDLDHYKNLSEFFRRSLKSDARIVDQSSCLASPCDGRILHFGQVEKGLLEQVKGVNYLLEAFLGKQDWFKNVPSSGKTSTPTSHVDTNNNSLTRFASAPSKLNGLTSSAPPTPAVYSPRSSGELPSVVDHVQYERSVLYNPNNCLYHCVIYLAPGDYHRFHSPVDWTIYNRRHVPGELFSVNPSVARWLQGLFNLNERVCYYGEWKYGFFSMSPVGATNVGSIKVFMDEEMITNGKTVDTNPKHLEKSFGPGGVAVKRGELFGEFNLGSTIVLIFEAPPNFEFNVIQNEKVFFGQPLGSWTTGAKKSASSASFP